MKNTIKLLVSIVLVLSFVLGGFVACEKAAIVTFDYTADGEFEDAECDEDEREVVVGEKIGKLPKPELEGYTFVGWFTEEEFELIVEGEEASKVKSSMKVEEDMTLYAWFEAEGAGDENGDENNGGNNGGSSCNHTFTKWTYEDATCLKVGYRWRECAICGERQQEDDATKPATGHSWNPETDIAMGSKVTCKNCPEEQITMYENITGVSLDGQPVLGGAWYSYNGSGVLVNGTFDDTGSSVIACKAGGVTVTAKCKTGVSADFFFVSGDGVGSYTVQVLYAGDSDYTDVGMGGFAAGGKVTKFKLDPTKNILEILITQAESGDSSAYWSEIALGKIK